MEAHALIPRIDQKWVGTFGSEFNSLTCPHSILSIPFPHLVLLCSGGHCLLALALGVAKYALLGRCLDANPGEMLDKCARMMWLDTHPDLQGL